MPFFEKEVIILTDMFSYLSNESFVNFLIYLFLKILIMHCIPDDGGRRPRYIVRMATNGTGRREGHAIDCFRAIMHVALDGG